MGQIDQLLRRIAGAPVRTVRRWRSRAISWKVITSNLLPEPSLSIIHHQLLPSRAGNGVDTVHHYCIYLLDCSYPRSPSTCLGNCLCALVSLSLEPALEREPIPKEELQQHYLENEMPGYPKRIWDALH